MAFDARDELLRLSHHVRAAYNDYVGVLETAPSLKATLAPQQRLDTVLADLRTCWEQKGVEEEVRKLTG